MKSLIALFVVLLSSPVFANLVGGLEGSDVQVNFDIMDYQKRNSVSMNVYIEGSVPQRHRQVSFYLDVETYIEIFTTNKNVHGEQPDGFDGKILYRAQGDMDNREIIFETQFLDDDGSIAQKEVTTINLSPNASSVNIKAYRRNTFAGWVGKLKKKSETEATGLSIDDSGIGLYGDNRDWPLGKVITIAGLRKAASDTSTDGLLSACEVECRR